MNMDGVVSAIGKTPLVRLTRLPGENAPRVYAKLEGANPGGSIKDRAALAMMQDAVSKGLVRPKGLVIESSSGNMAIALAQVCLYFDLRLICVVDPRATQQNLKILEAYGAEVEMVSTPDPCTGEYLVARLRRVHELLGKFPGAFWPDQYANTANSDAHRCTMAEMAEALEHKIDYLFCSTSTCGTLRGCAEYIQSQAMNTQIYAIDAVGSVIFGREGNEIPEKGTKRLIPGHGAAVRPALFQPWLAARCILVSDLDCVIGCRLLLKREGIMAGGSSGGVVMAFERVKHDLLSDSVCILIMPDRGERYLDTIYSDKWVRENFGNSAEFLEEHRELHGPHVITRHDTGSPGRALSSTAGTGND
jgi:N-(2-amino-2-carboxyethyl)-L-glutamate synthase